jgi:membrane associated rhomboid family serine protease
MMYRRMAVAALAVGISTTPVLAYIGPGAGIGALGTIAAVLGAIILMIVGFVWYPIKRLLRSRKTVPDKTLETK